MKRITVVESARCLLIGGLITLVALWPMQATVVAQSGSGSGGGSQSNSGTKIAAKDVNALGITDYDVYVDEGGGSGTLVLSGNTIIATIDVIEDSGGGSVIVTMEKTGETAEYRMTGEEYSALYLDGERVAYSVLGLDGEWVSEGYEDDAVAGSDAAMVLLNALTDQGFIALAIGPPLWPILIPLVPVYLIWCIGQCQCCENWYLTCTVCTPAPTCCANCNSPKCLDF